MHGICIGHLQYSPVHHLLLVCIFLIPHTEISQSLRPNDLTYSAMARSINCFLKFARPPPATCDLTCWTVNPVYPSASISTFQSFLWQLEKKGGREERHTVLANWSTLIPLIPTFIISSAIVLLAELSSLDFLPGLPDSDPLLDLQVDVGVFGMDLDCLFLEGVIPGLISSSSSSNSDPDSESTYSRLTTILILICLWVNMADDSQWERGMLKISSAIRHSASLLGDQSLTTRPCVSTH